MGAVGSRHLSSDLCVAQGERQRQKPQRPSTLARPSPSPMPVMPVLTMPQLPKLIPGKPLDPQQRRELVTLQQQVQVQLMQQRVLVESIRQLPQFRDMQSSFPGVMDRPVEDSDSMRAPHVIGPDPVGDTPADDLDSEEESKSLKSIRENDEKISNSTLGTTTKVHVDFIDLPPPQEVKKDEMSTLLEWDGLMKRGGLSPEDTGEPSIQSPRSLPNEDPVEKASEYSASKDSKASATPSRRREEDSNTSKPSRSPKDSPAKDASAKVAKDGVRPGSPAKGLEKPATEKPIEKETAAAAIPAAGFSPAQASGGFQRAGNPVAPRRPMPSPPPLKERPQVVMATLTNKLEPADLSLLGSKPPGREERRWIEAAVRRMFRSLGPVALENITEAFREWKLPPCTSIVKQQSPVTTGPGLCVLFEGVVDVLHRPMGGEDNEKVCTYDRCGQCFGELELFYDVPRGSRSGRKTHWATIATRTPVTLWTVHRDTLRGIVPGASTTKPPALDLSDSAKGAMSFV